MVRSTKTLETVSSLADEIADNADIHGNNGCRCEGVEETGEHLGDHDFDECTCRICFVGDLRRRIVQVVINGQMFGTW